jgi:hypothetical protein
VSLITDWLGFQSQNTRLFYNMYVLCLRLSAVCLARQSTEPKLGRLMPAVALALSRSARFYALRSAPPSPVACIGASACLVLGVAVASCQLRLVPACAIGMEHSCCLYSLCSYVHVASRRQEAGEEPYK